MNEPPAATARATSAATVQVRDKRSFRTAFTSFPSNLTPLAARKATLLRNGGGVC